VVTYWDRWYLGKEPGWNPLTTAVMRFGSPRGTNEIVRDPETWREDVGTVCIRDTRLGLFGGMGGGVSLCMDIVSGAEPRSQYGFPSFKRK
jgi:hypothetical protein